MARSRTPPPPPAVLDMVGRLGRNIATARKRRGLRQEDLAERAGITRVTLGRLERGAPGTGIGACAAVLWALGLEDELTRVADPSRDLEGQTLEAARRGERVRPSDGLDDAF